MNRRKFNKAVLAGGAAAVVASHAQAQTQPARSTQTRAKLLAALVEDRYGAFLSPEQMNAVRQRLQGQLFSVRQLANTPVENGDEPDFAFNADVSD